MIIDAWAQHPTLRHANDPMFDSLRRWSRSEPPTDELPLSATIDALDDGGVDRALISAWYAPHRVMISNDEVAGFVAWNSTTRPRHCSSPATPNTSSGCERGGIRAWTTPTQGGQHG